MSTGNVRKSVSCVVGKVERSKETVCPYCGRDYDLESADLKTCSFCQEKFNNLQGQDVHEDPAPEKKQVIIPEVNIAKSLIEQVYGVGKSKTITGEELERYERQMTDALKEPLKENAAAARRSMVESQNHVVD